MSVQKVLDYAISQVGYKEGANNDNKFAAIAGHANHQPWCATFVRACLIQGQEEKAIPNTAYCPAIESWARANNAVVPLAEARKGDLVLFDFDRKGVAEHVGILCVDSSAKATTVTTIDGNSGISGSQSNGDGVVKKARPISFVRLIVRPKWSKA